MNQLKSLLKLDYYATKSLHIRLYGSMLVGIVLAMILPSPSMIILFSVTSMVFILSIYFEITQRSNFDTLYGILPIKKTDMVRARYIFSLVCTFFVLILSFILFCIVSMIFTNEINWFNGIAMLSGSFVLTTFFMSTQYPFYFKYEFSKAAPMAMVPFVLTFAIGSPLLDKLLQTEKNLNTVMSIIKYLENNVALMVLASLVLGLCLLLISCTVSVCVVKAKKNKMGVPPKR